MERDRENIERELAKLTYYMNGALNFTDSYSLTNGQMRVLSETINQHHEAQAEAMKKGRKS
jgi:hypothetical protein